MSTPFNLDGQNAIVTGGGRGLGLEIGRALACHGANVLLVGRSEDTLAEACSDIGAVAGGRVSYFVGDVRSAETAVEAVSRLRELHGPVTILVNNAQQIAVAPLMQLTRDDFEAGWQSGPLAAVAFMQSAHEDLQQGGVVINMLSGAGVRWDMDTFGAYGAAKQAMTAITRTAACEWGPLGIRVLGVMPVGITDAWTSFEAAYPEAASEFTDRIPLRRMGSPEEIAQVVAFLCSPIASYMTGSIVKIDGGLVP